MPDSPPAIAITSLPATISAPGLYVLTSDLTTVATTGPAITIAASNVVLDLNGFTLSGKPVGPDRAGAAIAGSLISGLVVRNGIITGFSTGVWIGGQVSSSTPLSSLSRGCRIEKLLLYNLTCAGIDVTGTGNVVRGNQIVHVTGAATGCPAGISACGEASIIIDNDIVDVHSTPGVEYGVGINLNPSNHTIVENNRLSNPLFEKNSYGIFIGSSGDVLVINNRVINRAFGIYYSSDSTGHYSNNITQVCTTPYTGGTDDGGNH